MANSLAQYLADLQVQVKEAESRLVFGVVTSTSPLRVKYGEITLEDNFLFVEDGVTLTVGQKVPLLKTNRSQLFIVMLSKEFTPQEILSKIKTVDGSGSGLDADLLDGKHASDFSLDGHTQAWETLTGVPAMATRWPTWDEVTSKPSAFPPNSHTHTLTDVTDLSSIMDISPNGLGLAIGKASESNSFEVGMPIMLSDRPRIRGTSFGIENIAYLRFMEGDGLTRQGYIGFGSNANDSLYINNDVGSRILMNKDLYIDGNLTWHNGNISSQIALTGYTTFPNGIILQWGNVTIPANSSNGFAITFPLAMGANYFSTAMLRTTSVNTARVMTRNVTGMTVYARNDSGAISTVDLPCMYFAIGRI